ncbi:MAG: hypothetical protein OEX81_03205 [Candidatus Pacebacteria bacterium]|nr:hypothetical protein [Candidatus Paceibacterota bacterium]
MSKEISQTLAEMDKLFGKRFKDVDTKLSDQFSVSKSLLLLEDKRLELETVLIRDIAESGIIVGVSWDKSKIPPDVGIVDDMANKRYQVMRDGVILRTKVSLANVLESAISSNITSKSADIDRYKDLLDLLEGKQKQAITDQDDVKVISNRASKTFDEQYRLDILDKTFDLPVRAKEKIKRYLELVNEVYELTKKRTSIVNYEVEKKLDSRFEFVKPDTDDKNKYAAEWKRIWDINPTDKKGFNEVVRRTILEMEDAISKFDERAYFKGTLESRKFTSLMTFLGESSVGGYSVDKAGVMHGKKEGDVLGEYYQLIYNRLALADQAHMNGESSIVSINFEAAFKETIPKFGRFIVDYFTGSNIRLNRDGARNREKHSHPHYRVIRALDQAMTLYYDEMNDGFVQYEDKVDKDGNPIMIGKKRMWVVRDESGKILEEGADKDLLESKYPGMSVEDKWGTLWVARDHNGKFLGESYDRTELAGKHPKAILEDKYGAMYVVKDSEGNVLEISGNKDYLAKKHGRTPEELDSSLYKKFEDTLGQDVTERGYFSFGRAKWMSDEGGKKTKAMKARLLRDFACIPGVRRTHLNGEVVYTYGEDRKEVPGVKTEITLDKKKVITGKELDQAIAIAVDLNGLSATREQIFTSKYWPVGNSPYSAPNMGRMAECFPLAKELNKCKENILEIPYIVAGGDVPNSFFVSGAISTGLMSLMITDPDLRKLFKIKSQAEFEEEITNIDGNKDIRGLQAIRELTEAQLKEHASKLGKFLRFRKILISVNISRLKRDLLGSSFVSYSGSEVIDASGKKILIPNKSEARLYGHFVAERTDDQAATHLQRKPTNPTNGQFLQHLIAPPRHFLAEYGANLDEKDNPYDALDLSDEDMAEAGIAASRGDQVHKTQLSVHDAYKETYDKFNAPVPKLTGDVVGDVLLIHEDLTKLFSATSPLKTSANMVDWVYFYELLDMRIKAMIYTYREKHDDVFDGPEEGWFDGLIGKDKVIRNLIDAIETYIYDSGQIGVGSKELFIIPQPDGSHKRGSLRDALLTVAPIESPAQSIGEALNNFWLGLKKGHNPNTPIGRAKGTIYSGGIEQRDWFTEINRTKYYQALQRYNKVGFADPNFAVLTNAGLLNTESKAVKEAEDKQAKGD